MSATRQDIEQLGISIVGILEALAPKCNFEWVSEYRPALWAQVVRLIDLFIEKGGELGGEPWPEEKP